MMTISNILEIDFATNLKALVYNRHWSLVIAEGVILELKFNREQ